MKQFGCGVFRTQIGPKAIVAQMVQRGVESWVLRGAVVVEGIYFLHTWNIYGKSTTADTRYDLVTA